MGRPLMSLSRYQQTRRDRMFKQSSLQSHKILEVPLLTRRTQSCRTPGNQRPLCSTHYRGGGEPTSKHATTAFISTEEASGNPPRREQRQRSPSPKRRIPRPSTNNSSAHTTHADATAPPIRQSASPPPAEGLVAVFVTVYEHRA